VKGGIIEDLGRNIPHPISIHLALVKPGYLKDMIETLGEFGLREIGFVLTEFSFRATPSARKIRSALVEGARQTGMPLPKIDAPISFSEYLSRGEVFSVLKPGGGRRPGSAEKFLLGPEGGFSKNEEEKIETHPKFQGYTGLGPHVYKARTALSFFLGSLGET